MFSDLHALAQSATLLLAISAEGDQLRVSVTPTQAGDKTKPHALRPLTLLGTPTELDSDFGAALIAWQGPKQSLIEQAEAQAGVESESGTAKSPAKTDKADTKAAKGKPGPKKKEPASSSADKSADEANAPAITPVDDVNEANGTAETTAPSEDPAANPPPALAAAPVDTLTMNLF